MLEGLLEELLGCGSFDLEMLDKCSYDFSDIKNEIESMGSDINFSNIIYGAICIYKNNLQAKIDSKVYELECELKDLVYYVKEKNKVCTTDEQDDIDISELEYKIGELESLDVYDDIEEFINFLDTHLSLVCDEKKKNLYKKYLSDEINEEDNNIGFVSLDF